MGIKLIIKLISIASITLFIVLFVASSFIIKEIYDFKKNQKEGTMFVLEQEGKIISISQLKGQNITYLPPNQLIEINSHEKPLETLFKDHKEKLIIVFDMYVIESPSKQPQEQLNQLPSSLAKEDIVKKLKNPDTPQEIKDVLFLISISTIVNVDSKESLNNLVGYYNRGHITMNQKLVVLNLMAFVPERVVDLAFKINPK